MIRTKKRHQLDMCHGSLADKILLFAIPLMASSMLQLLFNAADVIVVGRFAGKESLAENGYILFVQTAARKYRMCLSVLRVRNRRRSNMGI